MEWSLKKVLDFWGLEAGSEVWNVAGWGGETIFGFTTTSYPRNKQTTHGRVHFGVSFCSWICPRHPFSVSPPDLGRLCLESLVPFGSLLGELLSTLWETAAMCSPLGKPKCLGSSWQFLIQKISSVILKLRITRVTQSALCFRSGFELGRFPKGKTSCGSGLNLVTAVWYGLDDLWLQKSAKTPCGQYQSINFISNIASRSFTQP